MEKELLPCSKAWAERYVTSLPRMVLGLVQKMRWERARFFPAKMDTKLRSSFPCHEAPAWFSPSNAPRRMARISQSSAATASTSRGPPVRA